MDKKQTILIVAPYFPPHSGGLERYAKEIAKGIGKKEDFNVEILTTSENGKDYVEDSKNYKIHRIAYSFKVSNTPVSFLWFLKIRKILNEIKPNIINIHTPVFGIGDIVAFLAKRNIPIVVTYHTGTMIKGVGGITDFVIWIYEYVFLKYLLARAKHIVCVSKYVSDDFLFDYKHKSSIITPAVNIDLFYSDTKRKTHNKVLFVAGLGKSEEYKGLKTLLKSFVAVVKEMPKVKLIVVGDGDKKLDYEKFVKENNLKDNVVFKGALFGQDLANEYRSADLLVSPTKKESFGMVIAEAMAVGLPVIANDVGGVSELVDDGVTGYLIKNNNVSELSKKIINLLSDGKKMMQFGINGENKIKKDFTWKKRINAYADLFNRLLDEQVTIAQIVGFYPPHVGGMEIVAQEISYELAKRNYDVRVFTSDLGAKTSQKVERKANYFLRRLKSVEIFHTPIMFSLPFRLFALPKNSVLHIHVAQAGIPEIALLIAKLLGFKYIAHFHLDVEPSGVLGGVFLLYKKYILGITLRGADSVIVFSNKQKELLNKKYRVKDKKLHIIPNGINEDFFYKHEFDFSKNKLRLLTVGRLTVQKRMDRIIEAVGMLKIPVELTIVGDGEDREKLERLADKNGNENIFFKGFVEHNKLSEYYKKADVLVMPSDKEGMPIVLLEAMAAGLPVVASNVLGIKEHTENVAVLVDNPSPEAFAKEIERISSSKEKILELSEKSVKQAKKYLWKESVAKMEKLYLN